MIINTLYSLLLLCILALFFMLGVGAATETIHTQALEHKVAYISKYNKFVWKDCKDD